MKDEFYIEHEVLRKALCMMGIAAPQSDGELGSRMQSYAKQIIRSVAKKHPKPAHDVSKLVEAHLVMPERMLHTSYAAGVTPSNAADVSAHRDGWNACLEEVDRLNASPAAPKGWKLVPTDPEQIQMVHTAFNLSGKYGVDFVSANKEFALDVYREMLDAAPCSDSVCRANCSSKPSHTDASSIRDTALELCDVIENKNDLQLHRWAPKPAYLVSKLRKLLDDAP